MTMNRDDYRAAFAQLCNGDDKRAKGAQQDQMARTFDVAPRTVRRWDEAGVDGPAAILLNLLTGKETIGAIKAKLKKRAA